MERYYLNNQPLPTGEYQLHMEHCQLIPNRSNRTYLGNFVSGFDAIEQAREFRHEVNGCYYCCREVYHSEAASELVAQTE